MNRLMRGEKVPFQIIRPVSLPIIRLEAKDLLQDGNTLQVDFSITNYNTPFASKLSSEYIIGGSVIFQLKVITSMTKYIKINNYNNIVMVRFLKLRDQDEHDYEISFTCYEFGIANVIFTTDKGIWHVIGENCKHHYIVDIVMHLETTPIVKSFRSLYEDTELIDFKLRGEDATIPVHRTVLAACSPVLRRLLSGTWKDTAEGQIEIPGMTKTILQYLKDYMYLEIVPHEGLEQLLLLASYYMMPDLEQKCVIRLAACLTAENTYSLLEFSVNHRMMKLTLAILESVQAGLVRVEDVRNYLFSTQ